MIYTYTSRRKNQRSSTTHALFLFFIFTYTHCFFFSFSLPHSPFFQSRIQFTRTYSINRIFRYCTASLYPSDSTLARLSLHLRFAAVVTLYSRRLLSVSASKTHRIFVVISINKEIPIQGLTPTYPMH